MDLLRRDRDETTSRRLPSATGASATVIRTTAALEALRPLWDSVPTSWAAPMKSHDWIRICPEVFGFDGDLEIVVAGSPTSVAFAPLFRSRQHGRRLELIGANQLYEAGDFVYSDRSDIPSLARGIARSGLPIRLERVPAESPIPAALTSAYRGRGIVVCRPAGGCPWIPLDQTWGDPEQHMTRHRRSNLRRAWRVAEGLGPVSCEILSPTPDELEPLLQQAYAVEAAGWKGQQKSALASVPLRGEFYRRYAAAASKQGILRLCFLRIGGRAAAMVLAVESGNRFWILKIGYSNEFARCSPGTLLMSETIRYAARAGLSSYELLGTDEPWTRVWTPLVRRCVSLRAYPFNVRGAMALARDIATMTPVEAKAVLRNRWWVASAGES